MFKILFHFRLNKVIRAKMSTTAQAHRIVTGLTFTQRMWSTAKQALDLHPGFVQHPQKKPGQEGTGCRTDRPDHG